MSPFKFSSSRQAGKVLVKRQCSACEERGKKRQKHERYAGMVQAEARGKEKACVRARKGRQAGRHSGMAWHVVQAGRCERAGKAERQAGTKWSPGKG